MQTDNKQVGDIAISQFPNALHMAYMERFIRRNRAFQQAQTEVLPQLYTMQFVQFTDVFQQEDDAYRAVYASLLTKDIVKADELNDRLVRLISHVVTGWLLADNAPEKQQAAVRFKFAMDKYQIDIDEAYEVEAEKIAQWLNEIMSADNPNAKDTQTLGLIEPVRDLYGSVLSLQDLIRQRNDERQAKQPLSLKDARRQTDAAYRLMVQVVNALATVDTDETRWVSLIDGINEDIHYYRATILAHRKSTDPEPAPDTNPDEAPDVDPEKKENI